MSKNKVVEVSIAMPGVMVVEETPVYPPFAEYTFDLAHLPSYLLQYCLDCVDQVGVVYQ